MWRSGAGTGEVRVASRVVVAVAVAVAVGGVLPATAISGRQVQVPEIRREAGRTSGLPVAGGAPRQADPAGQNPWTVPPLEAAVPDALGWETIGLAGATCGRGAPFKYFLNEAEADDAGLFVFMMGGGACMKDGPPPAGATGVAAQLHCMSFSNFTEPTDLYHLSSTVFAFFQRAEASNPFRDYHYVFVPYCTGDVHGGRMVEGYDYDPRPDSQFEVIHRGHLNVMAVLDDLQERFPTERPVVLTGSSAGGFGAIYAFPEVSARWPSTVLLPDAGIAPPAPTSLMARHGPDIAERWGASEILPPYCQEPECLEDSLRLLEAHAAHHDGVEAPWRPFGYLQGQRDGTLSDYLEISACSYQMALKAGFHRGRSLGNLRAYLPATAQHTFLASRTAFVSTAGVDVFEWFGRVAGAGSAEKLPEDAVDGWLPCNPVWVPALWGFGGSQS